MMRASLLVASAVLLFSINTHAIPSSSARIDALSPKGCHPLAADGCSSGYHRPRLQMPLRSQGSSEIPSNMEKVEMSGVISALRGGGGLGKKLGGKNLGMLVILLSLLYLPRAMSGCKAAYVGKSVGSGPRKIQRLGCGVGLLITNLTTLAGLALVLVNSRQYDRHGRSKLKMRLTGAMIITLGMLLVIAHAGLLPSGQSGTCISSWLVFVQFKDDDGVKSNVDS
jgi:hypothetical protein